MGYTLDDIMNGLANMRSGAKVDPMNWTTQSAPGDTDYGNILRQIATQAGTMGQLGKPPASMAGFIPDPAASALSQSGAYSVASGAQPSQATGQAATQPPSQDPYAVYDMGKMGLQQVQSEGGAEGGGFPQSYYQTPGTGTGKYYYTPDYNSPEWKQYNDQKNADFAKASPENAMYSSIYGGMAPGIPNNMGAGIGKTFYSDQNTPVAGWTPEKYQDKGIMGSIGIPLAMAGALTGLTGLLSPLGFAGMFGGAGAGAGAAAGADAAGAGGAMASGLNGLPLSAYSPMFGEMGTMGGGVAGGAGALYPGMAEAAAAGSIPGFGYTPAGYGAGLGGQGAGSSNILNALGLQGGKFAGLDPMKLFNAMRLGAVGAGVVGGLGGGGNNNPAPAGSGVQFSQPPVYTKYGR